MKRLWNYIDNKDWSEASKYRFTLFICSVMSAAAGLILWLFVRNRALPGSGWMLCFAGYPAVISWFAVILYALKHEFH